MSNKKVELLFQIRNEPCKINVEKTNKLLGFGVELNGEEEAVANGCKFSALVTVSSFLDKQEKKLILLNYSYLVHLDESDKIGRSIGVASITAENGEQLGLSLKRIFSVFDDLRIHAIQFIEPRNLTDEETLEKTYKELSEWQENYLIC